MLDPATTTADSTHATISALSPDSVAVAFSGGGDSTALLHMLRDVPNVTHALIVDHALRGGSADEALAAAHLAETLGYSVKIIRWNHDHPVSGIQVKARTYRYTAMGQACRDLGISHLVTAHTRDDQAETILMRKARDTGWRGLAGMRARAYGPLWPALAGVDLHRPLLDCQRSALRAYNAAHGLSFVDDPSNENRDFARIRARDSLSENVALTDDLLRVQARNAARKTEEGALLWTWLSRHAEVHPHGFVMTRKVPPSELLLHLLRAVSGTGGPIDAAMRENLLNRMAGNDFQAATLAGTWVVRRDKSFVFTRDMVAVSGRDTATGLQDMILAQGRLVLWDGRFFLRPLAPGLRVTPAFGHLQNLREHVETKAIFDLPSQVRPTLPVYWRGDTPIGFGAGLFDGVRATATTARRLQEKLHPVSVRDA